jgi:uncharacterized protein (DUF1778 family)
MTSLIQSKSARIDVRASVAVKQLLQEAARACHKNVSEFSLDRPVQSKPRLKKLLAQPGVLD